MFHQPKTVFYLVVRIKFVARYELNACALTATTASLCVKLINLFVVVV